MANSITTQEVHDGKRNAVIKVRIVGDASGDETAKQIVDVSALDGSPSEVRLLTVTANLSNFDAHLLWDATTDVQALNLSAGDSVTDFRTIGGLPNDAGTGVTGDIMLGTTGLGAERGTIVLELKKVYA